MAKDIASPHDEFFKYFMSQAEVVRTYIENYLPTEITAHMNLDAIDVDIEGYVDDDLKAYFSDVVATVQSSNGQPSEIYILFEHKSGLDAQARLQVLKYMVLKWTKWFKDQERHQSHLPVIIGVVVYHGKVEWRYSTAFSDMFRLPSDAFRPFVPSFEHILHDISHVDEASFKASVIVQIFLMLLKYIFRPDLVHKLPRILSLLNELSNKERITEYLPIIIKYILSTGNVTKKKIKEAAQSVPGGENVVETTADRLRQEGILIGEARGEARGETKAFKVMLQELLLERFDMLQPALEEKINSINSQETLKYLFRKAMKVESIQEFTRIIDRLS